MSKLKLHLNGTVSMLLVLVVAMVITIVKALNAAPVPAIGWTNGLDPDTVLLESIDAEVEVIDKHIHNVERWLGDGASSVTMTAYTCTPGTDDWGVWGAILDATDTPVMAGNTKFDLHKVEVIDVAAAELTRVQFGWSTASTAGSIVADGTFTEFVFFPTGIGANVSAVPIEIIMPRLDVGTRVWTRCWVDGEDGTAFAFLIGIHEYRK